MRGLSQQEIASHHVTTRASGGQHGHWQWLNIYSTLTHSAWIWSYGQSKELCLISIIDSQKMIQSIFRICRGHEKHRWSRLPPSPNTHCPGKHLHLHISSHIFTHFYSSQQSGAELEEGLPRKYVSYCPEQSPGQPRHSVHRPNTFLRSPGPAAKAAVMSATGLQEL